MVGLDGKTGQINWRYPADRQMAAGVAAPLFDASSNRLYWNNDESAVCSVDAANGQLIWQIEVAPANAPQSVMLRARPVLSGQSLIVGGSDGILRSLDAGNGTMRWSQNLGAPIRTLDAANFEGSPAILAISEREIVLVDAAQGEVIGRDTGTMGWSIEGGKGAIIADEDGYWKHVNW